MIKVPIKKFLQYSFNQAIKSFISSTQKSIEVWLTRWLSRENAYFFHILDFNSVEQYVTAITRFTILPKEVMSCTWNNFWI